MLKISSRKWVILLAAAVLLIVFTVFSVKQYQKVNKPFNDYTIIKKNVDIDEPFTYKKVTYTFHQPTIEEKDESIYYEVPITIKNQSDQPIERLIERSVFQGEHYGRSNMPDLGAFRQHPDNQNLTSGGVPPHETGNITMMTDMMKDWGVKKNSKMNFYHVIYDGHKVIKLEVALK